MLAPAHRAVLLWWRAPQDLRRASIEVYRPSWMNGDGVARRTARGAIAGVVVSTCLVWAWSATRTPVYETESIVVIPALPAEVDIGSAPWLVDGRVVGVAASRAVELGTSGRSLRHDVRVRLREEPPASLVVTATAPRSAAARDLADLAARAVAETYSVWATDLIEAEIEDIGLLLEGGATTDGLDARSEQRILDLTSARARIRSGQAPQIESAEVPGSARRPIAASHRWLLLLGGAVVGALAALAVDRSSRRIRRAADIPRRMALVSRTDVPAGAVQPLGAGRRSLIGKALRPASGEMHRALPKPAVIVVVDGGRGGSGGVIGAGLAAELVDRGRTVTVVDAGDGTATSALLGGAAVAGLREVLDATIEIDAVTQRTDRGVWVVPRSDGPLALKGRERRLAAVVGAAERLTSAVVLVGDRVDEDGWHAVAPLGDHLVVVLRSGDARRSTLRRVLEQPAVAATTASAVVIDRTELIASRRPPVRARTAPAVGELVT